MQAIAQRLPPAGAMINLCEDRYRFLVAYAAALSVGHTVLLPPSRAEQVVAEVAATHAGSYRSTTRRSQAALDCAVSRSTTRACNAQHSGGHAR